MLFSRVTFKIAIIHMIYFGLENTYVHCTLHTCEVLGAHVRSTIATIHKCESYYSYYTHI